MPSRISFEDLVRFDSTLLSSSANLIAGVDEAGRGALAGPVVAAAVICDPHETLARVRDSKMLSEPVREELSVLIRDRCLSFGVGIVEPGEIDRVNILNATMKAMKQAVGVLRPSPCLVLVDGRHIPELGILARAIKGGDGKSFVVAAASIIAKVARDTIMREMALEFPGYGFKRNKGYGTREHIEAIGVRGRTTFHRWSYHVRSLDEGSGGGVRERQTGNSRRKNRSRLPDAERVPDNQEKLPLRTS